VPHVGKAVKGALTLLGTSRCVGPAVKMFARRKRGRRLARRRRSVRRLVEKGMRLAGKEKILMTGWRRFGSGRSKDQLGPTLLLRRVLRTGRQAGAWGTEMRVGLRSTRRHRREPAFGVWGIHMLRPLLLNDVDVSGEYDEWDRVSISARNHF